MRDRANLPFEQGDYTTISAAHLIVLNLPKNYYSVGAVNGVEIFTGDKKTTGWFVLVADFGKHTQKIAPLPVWSCMPFPVTRKQSFLTS